MKLLFDENLSPALCRAVAGAFPGSQHVEPLGLRGRKDLEIWNYAALNGLHLVSKDDDFRQLSLRRGHPPKVLWLAVGNAGTRAIGELLRTHTDEIAAFLADSEAGLLVLPSAAAAG